MRFVQVILLSLLLGASSLALGDPTPMDVFRSGKVDEAIKSLNSRVASNPNDARAYADLCRVYGSLGAYDDAIQSCTRATQLAPNIAEYHLWLGRAYGDKADSSGPFAAIGWAKKTVAEFERAVQLDPADVQARADLAEYYREAPGLVGGGNDKARIIVDGTEKYDPAAAAVMRAQFALKDKDYSTAEREATKAIQAAGGSAKYILELARIYGKQKHWKDFEQTISRAMDAGKKRPLDMFDAADMLISHGRNLNGAIELLRSYLSGPMDEQGPAFRAHFLIGRAYEKQGKKSEAAKEYQAALELARGFQKAQDALRRVSG